MPIGANETKLLIKSAGTRKVSKFGEDANPVLGMDQILVRSWILVQALDRVPGNCGIRRIHVGEFLRVGIHHPEDFLGAIYRTHWSSIFEYFGLRLGDFDRDQAMFAPPKTQLVLDAPKAEETIVVPLHTQEGLRLDQTSLLSKLVEIWGEIPVRLIQNLDLRNGTYGFVGMSDSRMFPIIRPGSIVQIDQNQRKILPRAWRDEDDRPIYFVELRGGFLCSWCELSDGYLSSVPHPKSKYEVLRFSYPREAEIVGRVVGVTMRLTETG